MDREQAEVLRAIERETHQAFRLRSLIEHHRSIPICQFLVLPSHENPICWDAISIASRNQGQQCRLYCTCWRRDVDAQAMGAPIDKQMHPHRYRPTIETHWVPLDRGKLDAILTRFRTERIPLFCAQAAEGLDGTTYELAVGDWFCTARIEWWETLPDEWQELAPVVAALQDFFETSWKQHHLNKSG